MSSEVKLSVSFPLPGPEGTTDRPGADRQRAEEAGSPQEPRVPGQPCGGVDPAADDDQGPPLQDSFLDFGPQLCLSLCHTHSRLLNGPTYDRPTAIDPCRLSSLLAFISALTGRLHVICHRFL